MYIELFPRKVSIRDFVNSLANVQKKEKPHNPYRKYKTVMPQNDRIIIATKIKEPIYLQYGIYLCINTETVPKKK